MEEMQEDYDPVVSAYMSWDENNQGEFYYMG